MPWTTPSSRRERSKRVEGACCWITPRDAARVVRGTISRRERKNVTASAMLHADLNLSNISNYFFQKSVRCVVACREGPSFLLAPPSSLFPPPPSSLFPPPSAVSATQMLRSAVDSHGARYGGGAQSLG